MLAILRFHEKFYIMYEILAVSEFLKLREELVSQVLYEFASTTLKTSDGLN